MEVIIVVSDVLPTIVIYLNRKFNIEIEEAIKVVKKSQVLKGCSEDENEISLQEWLGKFLDELNVEIDTDKEIVKQKIQEFIK